MGLLNPLGVIGFVYVIKHNLGKTYRRGQKLVIYSSANQKATMRFHDGHGDLMMDMEVQWQPHHGNDLKNMIGWLPSGELT